MHKLSVESQITIELKRRIQSGEYSAIPSQRELTSEFKTSPTTISKVMHQLKSLGLVESTAGRGFKLMPQNHTQNGGIIGIVWHGASEPTVHESVLILNSIYQELTKNNQKYEMICLGSCDNSSKDIFADNSPYAGFIFLETFNHEALIAEAERRRIPYVVANKESSIPATSTYVNHQRSTATAVRILAAFGHRHIALITKQLDIYFYGNAFNGYRQGLAEAGLQFDEKLVINVGTGDRLEAFQITKDFFETNPIPSAIIACRDYLAAGAYKAVTDKGLIVGQDVSLIGFDNLSWAGGQNVLTTFNEPARKLGSVAAEMILDRVKHGFQPIEEREIEASIILRTSIGPCNKPNINSVPFEFLITT